MRTPRTVGDGFLHNAPGSFRGGEGSAGAEFSMQMRGKVFLRDWRTKRKGRDRVCFTSARVGAGQSAAFGGVHGWGRGLYANESRRRTGASMQMIQLPFPGRPSQRSA